MILAGRSSIGVLVMMLALVPAGCKKQTTTLIEPEPYPAPPPDTSFVEPEPLGDIDTSDDVSFREAEIEAVFRQKVLENLKPVYFAYNNFSLSQVAVDQLAVAGSFLMEYRTVRVLIEGHCDERGSSEYNMGLGESRARVCKDFLRDYGIPSVAVEITSWGKERPSLPGCNDDACHAQNRRVEFKVLAR